MAFSGENREQMIAAIAVLVMQQCSEDDEESLVLQVSNRLWIIITVIMTIPENVIRCMYHAHIGLSFP